MQYALYNALYNLYDGKKLYQNQVASITLRNIYLRYIKFTYEMHWKRVAYSKLPTGIKPDTGPLPITPQSQMLPFELWCGCISIN